MSFLTRIRPSLSVLRSGGSAVQPSLASASRIPLYYGATDSFAECGPSSSASGSVIAPFAFGGAVQIRNSTKRGGGSTKNNRNSAGKRLGPKKYGGQLVKEGQILIRQRGTEWHAGPHVGMGRDHTLYALAPGYVRYYAAVEEKAPTVTSSSCSTSAVSRLAVSPLEHATVEPTTLAYKPHPSSPKPRRRYIGIVFDQDGRLPAPAHAPRERRFGKADVAQLKRDRLAAIETARRDETFSAAPGGDSAWSSMLQNLSIQADASKAQI